MIKKYLFLILVFIFSANFVQADSVRISQIDSSSLLLNQNVKVYINATDNKGEPIKKLTREMFNIFESADGKKFTKINNIVNFETMANYESGINFLLLVDNSGSMYRTMQGRRTKNKNNTRIAHAKKAVKSFLTSISNPKDRVGLGVYNSNYNSYSPPIADKVEVEAYLQDINRPGKGERYTEIYSSLYLAVDEFDAVKGRKAIIILSDGENQPYYKYTGKPHKTFGKKTFKYNEPIKYCQEEGISVFAIYFGPKGHKKDKNLHKIAMQTGGATFSAHNENDLSEIYNTIVKQILNEYLITYKATMEPADKKFVKVVTKTKTGKSNATRFYFSSSVFGLPLNEFNPLLLLPLLLAFGLLWLLTTFKFEKKQTAPSIEVLHTQVGAKVATKMFTLNKGKTIIGGSPNADMTIVGGKTKIEEKHAAIVFDNKKKKYTLIGEAGMKVNNKPVKTRVLDSGDVINIGGTTIVFDENDMK